MPDPVTIQSTSGTPAATPTPASPAPAGQPAAGSSAVPEKFKDAKLEDVIKSYVELEGKFGEQGKKLGTVNEYEKLGSPKDVSEALAWARDTYAKIQRGELTPKQAQQQAAQQAAVADGAQAPWQDQGWEFLPPAEQSAKLAAYNQQAVLTAVRAEVAKLAEGYGNQINQMRQTQSREQSLMFTALQEALASGGKVNLKEALEQAAVMATKPPEEFIQMAIKQMLNPGAQEADIEAKVTARVAEQLQKEHNKTLDGLAQQASPQPRFAQVAKTRQDETRQILDAWTKAGINP